MFGSRNLFFVNFTIPVGIFALITWYRQNLFNAVKSPSTSASPQPFLNDFATAAVNFGSPRCPWSSVAEWLECWTQVNFTRARGPGFDSWTDPSKNCQASGQSRGNVASG